MKRLTALVVAIASAWTPAARAWCRTTTVPANVVGQCSNEGTPLAWQSVCAAFSLYFRGSPDVALDDVRTQATLAGARWHTAACDANGTTQPYFQLLPLDDTQTPTGYNPTGPNANTVSFNSTWASDAAHRPGTIAITLVTFNSLTGEILDADTELNEQSDANPGGFHFTVGAPDPASADLPTILTHEFGHFHGLGHSMEDTAVMWPTAGLGEQRRELRNDDVSGICDVYPPSAAPAGRICNAVPYGGLAIEPHGAVVQGGCAVRSGHAPGGVALPIASLSLSVMSLRRRRRGRVAARGR